MHKMPYVLNSIISQLFSEHIYRVLALIAATGLMLASNVAFSAEASPTCPADHAMYYVGSKNFSPAPAAANKLALSWTGGAGNTSTTYNFNNNLEFKLSFSETNFLAAGYPEASSFGGVTTNAINMRHSSQYLNINHKLTATINKPVSKYGFVVQDLDSNENGRYTESVSLFSAGGAFSNILTANHTLSNSNRTITGNQWPNCSPTNPCNFNVDWGSQSLNTPFVITHGNTYRSASTTTSTGDHVVGYSDFYFCLAPPKLIVKKVLTGTRFNDSDTKRDQFNIKVAGGKLTPDSQGSTASFTTTGAGSTITNGSTVTPLELAPSTTYTISENIINGDATNYNTSYVCSNATTGSNSSTPSGNTSSFTLSNLNYGDEVTCIITNTPKSYSFSGIVFNDNGKIINPTKDDVSDKYLNNRLYFNGKYDSPTESGIPFTTGHTITLNKCADDTSTSTFTSQTVNISDDGTYSFTLTPAQLGSNTKLCATQNEPNNYTYSVDTTSNLRQINITTNTFNYPDNNFGDVIQDNAALVLFKSQYTHNCSLTDLTTINVNYMGSASTAYSTNSISEIIPGQCIAYRIEAVNRGNVPLTDIIIRDTLQKKGENGALVTSTLATPTPIGENSGVPSFSNSSVSIGNNGQVLTNGFPLGITSSDRRRAIRFNTKYGTTVNP